MKKVCFGRLFSFYQKALSKSIIHYLIVRKMYNGKDQQDLQWYKQSVTASSYYQKEMPQDQTGTARSIPSSGPQ